MKNGSAFAPIFRTFISMKARYLIMGVLALVSLQLPAQDLPQFKRIVKELSSAKYQGRGYARGGANKAGKYLQREFQKAGADA